MKACSRQALSLSRRFHSFSLRNSSLSPPLSSVPLLQYQTGRWLSSSPVQTAFEPAEDDSKGPMGDLFRFPEIGSIDIIGKKGSIRRSFGPQSNAEAMITCGGEALAAQASFDPNYLRAKDWIRSHPVGPAVLSPVLISGLVGALVEAAFPKAIAIGSQMQFLRPLIVGVEVRAQIEVIAVAKAGASSLEDAQQRQQATENDHRQHNDVRKRKNGYQVNLKTNVLRINDGLIIAEGGHSIWIPDYLHM